MDTCAISGVNSSEIEVSILNLLIDPTGPNDEPPAKRVKRVKRSQQSKKIAHNLVQRRRTTRINELILAIHEHVRCVKKDKISILEAALKKLSES